MPAYPKIANLGLWTFASTWCSELLTASVSNSTDLLSVPADTTINFAE